MHGRHKSIYTCFKCRAWKIHSYISLSISLSLCRSRIFLLFERLLRFMCTIFCVSAYAFACMLVSKYREKDIGLSISPFCTQLNRIAADLWKVLHVRLLVYAFESPTLWFFRSHSFCFSLFLYREVFTYADKQWSTVNERRGNNEQNWIYFG